MPDGEVASTWDFVALQDPESTLRHRILERVRFAEPMAFRLAPSAVVESDSTDHEQMVHWAFETGRLCPLGPVELVCIEDAVLTKEGVVFLDTGECVLDSLHPWTPENMRHRFGSLIRATPTSDAMRQQASSLPEIESAVHLREPGETGYFHWINSVLPRAAMVDRVESLGSVPLAIDRSTRFARESLDLLGLASRPLLAGGSGYRVKRLWMASPTNLRGDHFTRHPFWTREVRRRMVPKRPLARGRRIYISRNDSKVRRVVNEDEVVACLARYGFEAVSTSTMTMAEQVELFNETSILLSPHGAGLSNAIFMPRGLVVEIVSRSRLWPTFRTLAGRCGQEYAAYISEFVSASDNSAVEVGNEDIVIKMDPFRQFCSEMEGLFKAF